LIAEAGDKGEKIVVLDAVDPTAHTDGLVVFELLKKLGLNAELASSDWGSLVIRRPSKKPVEEGGWDIFGTGWTGVETLDPSADLPLAANGGAAWFSWPEDEMLKALRTEWLKTPDTRRARRSPSGSRSAPSKSSPTSRPGGGRR
jgi:peptide/nickel transport system substrate-binding protein